MPSYGKQTNNYKIPYLISGDIITDTEEEKISKIIDNQMFGAMRAAGVGVIDEGAYSSFDPGSGTYRVLLMTSGAPSSLTGIVNRAYIDVASTLVWNNLTTGSLYYLYVIAGSTLFTDPSDVTTVALTTPVAVDNESYLLLATYDLTSGFPGVLDSSPSNKAYIQGAGTHAAKDTDPHGETLNQTNLKITNDLDVDLGINESVNINQPNVASTSSVVEINNLGTGSDIKSLNELKLEDIRSLTTLSETGETALTTTKQSLIGSINELDSGLTAHETTDILLAHPNVGTMATQSSGNVNITGGSVSGITLGGVSFNDSSITGSLIDMSPIGSIAPTGGTFTQVNVIQPLTGSTAPTVTINNLGTGSDIKSFNELKFEDVRAVIDLSETGEVALTTTKQSLVGGINELDAGLTTTNNNLTTTNNDLSTHVATTVVDAHPSDSLKNGAVVLEVRNTTGATLVNGTLVYVSGYDGTTSRSLVDKADITDTSKWAQYVLIADLLDATNGRAYRAYKVGDQDTSGLTIGDVVYLSTTPGVWSATSSSQAVGRVTVVDALVGELLVVLGGGSAPVQSVFGRIDNVVATTGDYSASQVNNDSGVDGVTVSDALDTINNKIVPVDMIVDTLVFG